MATQDVLDQTITHLTALATPSTAVADIDAQIAALFAQVQTLQAQRAALAPEGAKAKQLLNQLSQVVAGRGGGGGLNPRGGGLVINTPSIAAVQAAQTAPDVLAPPVQTPST